MIWGSLVNTSITTRLGSEDRGLVLGRVRYYFLHYNVQIHKGDHPASCSMDIAERSLGQSGWNVKLTVHQLA
jgi:hypothetical protein